MEFGLSVFKEHFADYTDQYVVIGGAACDLLLSSAGLDFRQTRDIDMVLIVESLTEAFGSVFWKFIEDGRYSARLSSNQKPEYYRFVEPEVPEYPYMVELFARPEGAVNFEKTGHLAPVHISDDISSLSAILLNESYYSFMLKGKTVIDGVSIVDAEHLIPLKMRAWLDLNRQKAEGIHVNEKDLRKHRRDIFRLFPVIDEDAAISVPRKVYSDIQTFIDRMGEMDIDLKGTGVMRNKEAILDVFRHLYVMKV
ncbi:MAG: hypothetical protein IJI41_03915 [Anaerolineaceae bacterium]|nr:hypothetical protein [Anaerolineaceae bacterium]